MFQTFNRNAAFKPLRAVPGIQGFKNTNHLVDKNLTCILLNLLCRPLRKTNFQVTDCGFAARFQLVEGQIANKSGQAVLNRPR
jgi:competence protein ComGC